MRTLKTALVVTRVVALTVTANLTYRVKSAAMEWMARRLGFGGICRLTRGDLRRARLATLRRAEALAESL